MDALDSAALLALLVTGAVVTFTLTGSAALGTVAGALGGMAVIALRHRHPQR